MFNVLQIIHLDTTKHIPIKIVTKELFYSPNEATKRYGCNINSNNCCVSYQTISHTCCYIISDGYRVINCYWKAFRNIYNSDHCNVNAYNIPLLQFNVKADVSSMFKYAV